MKENNHFVDTNVILYLLSDDIAKADAAEAILAKGGVISVQVLNEFSSVASRKLGMSWREIREILDIVRVVCSVVPVTVKTHDHALDLSEGYGFSIYDSSILASAILAGCITLFTEDLQNGQRIDDQIIVRNPFIADK